MLLNALSWLLSAVYIGLSELVVGDAVISAAWGHGHLQRKGDHGYMRVFAPSSLLHTEKQTPPRIQFPMCNYFQIGGRWNCASGSSEKSKPATSHHLRVF